MTSELTQKKSISQFLADPNVSKAIEDSLKNRSQQFVTSVISLVSANPKLAECDRKSLLSACMTAAALNLPINQNLGFAYIIPYKDQAQFQMGFKGFIQLALRSGLFTRINVSDVKEGELKSIDRLSGDIDFVWADEGREKLKTIGYVAYFKLNNGFEKSHYMTSEELKAHGVKFSQTAKKGFGLWVDDFDAMAKKTVLKLLISKYAPMNSELQEATLKDQAIIVDDQIQYVDNQAELPEEVSRTKEIARIIKHISDSKTTGELEKCKQAAMDTADDDVIDAYITKEGELLADEVKV